MLAPLLYGYVGEYSFMAPQVQNEQSLLVIPIMMERQTVTD